jgi:hypothetical protein
VIASEALQVALYNALNGQVGVPVFDEVPPEDPSPRVVIGEGTERPWDTMTDEGSEETVTLHVWSRAKGSREVKSIMEAVDARLHNVRLTLTDATMVIMQREFVEVLKEPAEAGVIWRHGVMRYRTLLTE